MKDKKKRSIIFYYVAALIIILLLNLVVFPKFMEPTVKEIEYSEFLRMLEDGEIAKVEIEGTQITIEPKNLDKKNPVYYKTGVMVVEDSELISMLKKSNVDFSSPISQGYSFFTLFLLNVLPFLVVAIVISLIFRSMSKKMSSGVMSFGKNTSKIYAEKSTGKTFEDVAGQDEAKASLAEIIDFLNSPQKYTDIGAKLPKGALLVGPPGTGKTLLAKAVAGEAKVPFFSLSGSEFVEMFVGMGASRVRDLFRQAVENAPCIVFIDEIDAIGKSRDNTFSSNDEREQTLNQLLSEMDGFDSSKGVVILAATNRPEVLDKALLRPGRFDRRIIVDLPDQEGRVAILKVHAKAVVMEENVNLDVLARSTPGASGADLANIINEAALRTVRAKKTKVGQKELEDAVEVILAGEEKKSTVLSELEKRVVAYHEIGHALVSALLTHTEPVHKITIIPRTSGALGYTLQVAKEEKHLMSKKEALEQITVFAGGRAAEEIEFDSVTTGASNDIERATQIARNMVTIYGMSDQFGFVNLERKTNIYLGDNTAGQYSEETASKIDKEVRQIITHCYQHAVSLLQGNKPLLDQLAQVLYQEETITGDRFMELLDSFRNGEESGPAESKIEEEEITQTETPALSE